jgi:hypothetical protein
MASTTQSAVIHAFPASRRATVRQTDPVFAAIAEHRRADVALTRVLERRDRAESAARRKHGECPYRWIAWRRYSSICGQEIERARDEFLLLPEISRRAILREYRDAKARERRQIRAAQQWARRAGMVGINRECDLADAAEWKAARKVAKTKPTTPAGAAALLEHVNLNENMCSREDYEIAAVQTVIKMLRAMTEPGAARRAA